MGLFKKTIKYKACYEDKVAKKGKSFKFVFFFSREVKGAPVLKILDLSSSNLNDEALYQVQIKSQQTNNMKQLKSNSWQKFSRLIFLDLQAGISYRKCGFTQQVVIKD